MSTRTSTKTSNTIGIPLALERHNGHCSVAVGELVGFLRNVAQTQRALRDMGVNLSGVQSIQGNVQIFNLVRTDQGKATPIGDPATNDESNHASMSAVSVVHACLNSAVVMAPNALSPMSNTEPEPSSDAACIEKLDVELIRRRIASGPSYVLLDGKATPWSATVANFARGNLRPKPQPVVIEPVGSEVHLITGKRRYHPEDATDVSAVKPGSRVIVEAGSTERMLFVDPILQIEMDLPEGQSES